MTLRFALALIAVLATSAPAFAQTALERAEAAYQDVDFETTNRQALAALGAGNNTPTRLVRIYQLLGISASALGREAEAREHFVRMLALDPRAELDASVPPRLRDPYLEARGVWAARQGQLGIVVGLDRARSTIRVELTDPSGMSRRVIVHARLEGAAHYATADSEARTAIEVPVQGAATADRIEYFVELLDEHRNVMRSEGTAFQPRIVGRDRVGTGPGSAAAGSSILEEPVLWIVVGVLVAGGAAAAIGIVADQRSRIGAQSSVRIGIDL